jgi:hypothetical protein
MLARQVMESMLRQWCILVLRPLCQRLAQRSREPPPISDYEMAQLAQDTRCLYNDLTRHSLLSCTPVRAQKGWSYR